MSGEITKEMDAAIHHISRALGKALNLKGSRTPNGRLRVGITSEQRKLASLLLKSIELRLKFKARDE
jgi:hypothetical protein